MLDIGWECISPKNITLEVFIAIYFWSREGGGPSTEESNIVTHQENGQPLPQVADTLRILLANVSGQMTPQPGDGLQGDRVPAPQGVDSQGDEGDPLPGTPLLVLPRFASVGALDCTAAILGGASDQSILEGIDDGDIEGGVLAPRPEWDQDICWSVITSWQ